MATVVRIFLLAVVVLLLRMSVAESDRIRYDIYVMNERARVASTTRPLLQLLICLASLRTPVSRVLPRLPPPALSLIYRQSCRCLVFRHAWSPGTASERVVGEQRRTSMSAIL